MNAAIPVAQVGMTVAWTVIGFAGDLAIDGANASIDYDFDIGASNTRLRFGVNNLTNERAPLSDSYFGYSSDAHRDYGRSYYFDVRVAF